ncbi:hypothetical protein RN07_3120 [Mycobacterium tuberculosis variant bovis]|nr:hypothetical protein RN07_3120 [Mycobacterium tuberculosis variant bovis]
MVATRCARLRRAAIATGFDGGDPLRAAAPRLRSPRGLMVATAARAAPRLRSPRGLMVATRCARLRALAIATRGLMVATAARGCAALAIATGLMVATRCARLRRACDRHGV